jgi:branched-chain amino acid transport system permease protein
VARTSDPATPTPSRPAAAPGSVAFILKKSLLSAFLALVLFSLMIGIRTEAGPEGQLIYWTRFGDLAAMVVAVSWSRCCGNGWDRHASSP